MATPCAICAVYKPARLRGERDIRVLNILPPVVQNSDTEPVQAYLSVLGLDQQRRFTTLSYAWGRPASASASPSKTLFLYGGRSAAATALPVSDNCHAAIRALRRKYGSLAIWIDAVCINQDDVAEKEHQITLMGDIYAQSDTTFVWLGESSGATDSAMDLLGRRAMPDFLANHQYTRSVARASELKAYLKVLLGFHTLAPKPNIRKSGNPELDKLTLPGLSLARLTRRLRDALRNGEPETATFQDLEELLTRPWIRRIWTYQEIIFAAHPVVVCGDRFVEWSRFAPNVLLHDQLAKWRYGILRRDAPPRESSMPHISTWERIVLMREKIRHTHAGPDGATNASDGPTLEQYQRFFARLVSIHFGVVAVLCAICGLLVVFLAYIGKSKSVAGILFPSGLFVLLACLAAVLWRRLPPFANHPRWEEDPTIQLVDELLHRRAQRHHDLAFGIRSVLGRLLDSELPAPDYARPLERVFRDATVQLLRLTGSSQILVAAALRAAASAATPTAGPSWVPDWSADPCMIWWHWHYYPYGVSRPQHIKWRMLSGEPHILRVRGFRTCTITAVYQFWPTDDATHRRLTKSSRRRRHLDNLRAMRRLRAVNWGTSEYKRTAWFLCTLLNAATSSSSSSSSSSSAKMLNDYDVSVYMHFLFLASGEDAERALSWIAPEGSGFWATRARSIRSILSPRSAWHHKHRLWAESRSAVCDRIALFGQNLWRKLVLCSLVLRHRPTILQMHARLCTRLAHTGHVAVSPHADGPVGICRASAEAGHQLVQFVNTPMVFVVARCGDSRIRLVSPAVGLEMDIVDGGQRERRARMGLEPSMHGFGPDEEFCIV
ncbi:Heterokaryon incompatibility [Niveomyces insectorum RCEF 264]|uniref:Heterokaryon incompatibility n=1 Tax=Niveomyces insectorum RCEF 264 TaxID=1081102 RepID=A0A162J4I3_9HYPO|nr:Heterokaryon incompatibility [Niveomyces insectorum RCEF 264]